MVKRLPAQTGGRLPDPGSVQVHPQVPPPAADGGRVRAGVKPLHQLYPGLLSPLGLVAEHHFQQFVESTEIVDDLTALVKFKSPAPRFKFEVLTEKREVEGLEATRTKSLPLSYSITRRKRRASVMTDTDDRLIAAAAIIGDSKVPVSG